MPSNIEIKARVRDFSHFKTRAEKLSDAPLEVINQEDVFFNIRSGRLKLRILAKDRGQLIHYNRPDQDGPKRSDYQIYETSNPESLRNVLALSYGVRGIVKKVRYLYMVGQTRIHLDDVEGLGQFMELEVVMQEGQSDADGQSIAEGLMAGLGVESNDLLNVAYMDLLEKRS